MTWVGLLTLFGLVYVVWRGARVLYWTVVLNRRARTATAPGTATAPAPVEPVAAGSVLLPPSAPRLAVDRSFEQAFPRRVRRELAAGLARAEREGLAQIAEELHRDLTALLAAGARIVAGSPAHNGVLLRWSTGAQLLLARMSVPLQAHLLEKVSDGPLQIVGVHPEVLWTRVEFLDVTGAPVQVYAGTIRLLHH